MRIEELAYRTGGATRSLTLHPSLTVITGLDAPLRRAWAQRIFELLHGLPLSTDMDGVPETLTLEGGDQVPCEWLGRLGVEAERTARHMILEAEALLAEIEDAADPDGENEELRELRALAEAAEAEHRAAIARHHEIDKLRQRHLHLEALVHAGDERVARHRHGHAVLEVSRLEAELALLGGGSAQEREAAQAAVRAARAADAWRAAVKALEEARSAFGSRPLLDPARLALRLTQPTEPPAGLADRHEALLVAIRHRDALLARLREEAAAVLPDTATPWVRELARLDQAELWARAEGVVSERRRLADLAVGLGDPSGAHAVLMTELDALHEAVDQAERAVARTRFPALSKGAKKALAHARDEELAAFERAGFSSWLGLQLRRVDATLQKDAMASLHAAQADLGRSEQAWAAFASDVAVEDALSAREEIEALAATLLAAEAHRGSFEAIRAELDDQVEPAVAAARSALAEIYAPYGLDTDAEPGEVAAIVAEAQLARLQVVLAEVERDHADREDELERFLAEAGLPGPAPLATRADIVSAQFGQDVNPDDSGRSREEVSRQLAAARDELRSISRPDWNDTDLLYELLTESVDDDGHLSPDDLALVAERDRVADEIDKLMLELPDEEALAERRYELARRLEGMTNSSRQVRMEAAEMALIRRFAHTRRAGPEGEPVPLVIDDALASFHVDDKAELLGLVARLSGASQVLYLTADDETIDWAEARHGDGTAALLSADDTFPVVP
jgi:hypothetical protein